jgi:hypothetical protein
MRNKGVGISIYSFVFLLGRLFHIENTAAAYQCNDQLTHQQFNLCGETNRGTNNQGIDSRL